MSAPILAPDLATNPTCDGLLFTDSTTYTGTDITSAQVTRATVKVSYSSIETYIQYVFTIASNVITDVTLDNGDGNPADISSYIGDTISDVFPLVDFDVSGDYGVTIPTVEDGVYYTSYRIQGLTEALAPFSYTGAQQIEITCSTSCCIAKMFQEISTDCACEDKKLMTAMRAQAYLLASQYATQVGNTENATAALNLASSICEQGCGCGG